MKKLLITVCLSGLLSVPSAVLGAEMAGPNLYGSFRAALSFGSGDVELVDGTSRWGFKGSYEVSEGLTASYKYESKFNITNAESSGGNDSILASAKAEDGPDSDLEAVDAEDDDDANASKMVSAGGPGGRHSNISLSGGFGTVTLGQFWSATANHYGFAVDPSIIGGAVAGFGGASYRNANTVSYASNAGDVSFQIDKVLGDAERIEFGASAALGPVGVGLGYWSNANDEASFTGVAISAGAAGVNLSVGLGSSDSDTGVDSDTSILHVGGSVGDSGLGYAVQVINGETDADDQNFVLVTNSLGSGASLFFEHVSPGVGDASSVFGLMVDF